MFLPKRLRLADYPWMFRHSIPNDHPTIGIVHFVVPLFLLRQVPHTGFFIKVLMSETKEASACNVLVSKRIYTL
jgi:hypothetical protein